jgi:hypothetical protein
MAYELYVHDVRYSVPTLHLLNTASESEARRIAETYLAEAAHHQRIELWLGESRVAAWGRKDLARG